MKVLYHVSIFQMICLTVRNDGQSQNPLFWSKYKNALCDLFRSLKWLSMLEEFFLS